MPRSTISRVSRVSRTSRASEGAQRRSKKARSVRSAASASAGAYMYAKIKIQEELREAGVAAEKARKDNMRNNKIFMVVKRDLENKKRAKEKEKLNEVIQDLTQEEYYVDRDRCAAVTLGSKDISKEVKDRKSFMEELEHDEDNSWILTYIKQGQYEAKNGLPERAIYYFDRAVTGLNQYFQDTVLYIMRSECHCRVGNFDEADADADTALDLEPYNVKALMAKGEAQYNMGNFEHALKYFWRAFWERPGLYCIRQGLVKSRSAIENTLQSDHLDFQEMKDIIEEIIQDPDNDLGYVYAPKEDPKVFQLNEEELAAIGGKKPEYVSENEEDEEVPKFLQPLEFKRRKSSLRDIHLTNIDVERMLGLRGKEDTEKVICDGLRSKVKNAKQRVQDHEKEQRRRYNIQQIKMAEKQLLGALHKDHLYLRNLIKDPIWKKHQGANAIENDNKIGYITRAKIIQTAREGLAFLEKRKVFWQQQEPVFARKFRTATGDVVTLV